MPAPATRERKKGRTASDVPSLHYEPNEFDDGSEGLGDIAISLESAATQPEINA